MIIEGMNALLEYIKSDKKVELVEIYSNININRKGRVISLCEKNGIPVKMVKKRSKNNEGIVAYIEEALNFVDLDEFIESTYTKEKCIAVLLDNVQDPRNLGAILRSADAFGVDIVIIPELGGSRVTEAAIKTSTGAASHVPICYVGNLGQAVEKLKKANFWTYGADMDGKRDYMQESYSDKTAIIVGSEGFGMRKKIKEKCDFIVNIPMSGHVNSLNVSVAASIILSAVHIKIKK
jgi:23S rRNA (guanosine2251-2'-O)-methyltransferase